MNKVLIVLLILLTSCTSGSGTNESLTPSRIDLIDWGIQFSTIEQTALFRCGQDEETGVLLLDPIFATLRATIITPQLLSVISQTIEPIDSELNRRINNLLNADSDYLHVIFVLDLDAQGSLMVPFTSGVMSNRQVGLTEFRYIFIPSLRTPDLVNIDAENYEFELLNDLRRRDFQPEQNIVLTFRDDPIFLTDNLRSNVDVHVTLAIRPPFIECSSGNIVDFSLRIPVPKGELSDSKAVYGDLENMHSETVSQIRIQLMTRDILDILEVVEQVIEEDQLEPEATPETP